MVVKSELNIYLNFIHSALYGMTKESDAIMCEYRDIIVGVANKMHELFPVERKELYRGLLLEPKYINERCVLEPIEHIKTLSFSESYEAASVFSDTNSEMSSLLMQVRPMSRGYMIKYTPEPSEILYHYSWLSLLSIDKLFTELDMDLLNSQKEVILENRMHHFQMEPVNG